MPNYSVELGLAYSCGTWDTEFYEIESTASEKVLEADLEAKAEKAFQKANPKTEVSHSWLHWYNEIEDEPEDDDISSEEIDAPWDPALLAMSKKPRGENPEDGWLDRAFEERFETPELD